MSDPFRGEIKMDDLFRPNLAAEIDDTRTWVDPNGYRLSDRLWRAGFADRAQINDVLRRGLATGASPLQVAKNVEHLLNPYYQLRRDPDTFAVKPLAQQPKGVATLTPRQGPGKGPARPRNSGTGSYAARRLARTETTRAFGAASQTLAKANAFVRRMKWRLSSSHHEPDQCDQNAAKSSRDQPKGVWLIDELPRYPDHPQEMCTLGPYVTNDDVDDAIPRLKRAMIDGDFSRAALSQPMTAADLARIATPVAEPPAPQDTRPAWLRSIDEIKQRQLAQYKNLGTIDEAEIRKAGAIVKDEMVKRSVGQAASQAERELADAKAAYEKVNAEAIAARSARNLTGPQERRLWARRNKLQKAFFDAEDRAAAALKNPVGANARDVLGDVRKMGATTKHPFRTGSMTGAKNAVNDVARLVPEEWWESSRADGMLQTRIVKRGYYSDSGRGYPAQLNISGNLPNDLADTAVHEFGHRVEYVRPQIRAAEQSFYERRTSGEPLEWLGARGQTWYSKSEVTRFDEFGHPYIGKDYGGRAYEVVSMGIEDVMRHGKMPEYITSDQDYFDFILGVLAVL